MYDYSLVLSPTRGLGDNHKALAYGIFADLPMQCHSCGLG